MTTRSSKSIGFKSLIALALLVATSLCLSIGAIAANGVIPKDVLTDYKKFIGTQSPNQLRSFKGRYSRRDVVEVAIILQALSRAEEQKTIEFKVVESYSRQLADVASGRAALAMTSVSSSDAEQLKNQVYFSDELVKPEEFVAGFYVRRDNENALNAKSLQDLAKLKTVSNSAWHRDWETLHAFMPSGHVYNTVVWSNMVKMVDAQRVDFVLAPFQANEQLILRYQSIELAPIPNIKISLGEGRRIIFSKKHPKGERLYKAFQIGLQSMRSEGMIKKAYSESGFFNQQVADWNLLAP